VLGELVGKAAGAVWLYEHLRRATTVLNCFSLAVKYYCKRAGSSRSNLEELQDLIASDFLPISAWVSQNEHTPIVQRNIGLAFFLVFRWDDCIRCIKVEDPSTSVDEDGFAKYLAYAFMCKRDYDSALAVVGKHCRTSYSILILQIYQAKGDYDASIELLWNFVAELADLSLLELIYDTCNTKGDYATAVNLFQAALDKYPRHWTVRYYLAIACQKSGDYDRGIDVLQAGNQVEIFPSSSWSMLAGLYIKKCNYDEAINVMRTCLESCRRPDISPLIHAYTEKGDTDGLIKELENLVHTDPAWVGLCISLAKALEGRKDFLIERSRC
jgi:tetratricopeptide (TPR) repeat protein